MPEAGLTTPAQSTTVDGGNARDAERQMTENGPKVETISLDAYQGLQRKQNATVNENRDLKEQLDALSQQFDQLQQQNQELQNNSQSLSQATEQLATEKNSVATEAEALRLKLSMYEMASDPEFQYLDNGIVGTLQPRETPEATREMLKEWDARIGQIVQKQVASEMSGVTATASPRNNTPTYTVDQLRTMALEAVDSNAENKGQLMDAYYKALEQGGGFQIPMPITGAFDND